MEFLLTGDTISADQAQQMGLINRIVAAEELYPEVEKIVAKLIQNAPLALQAIKRTAILSSGVDLDEAFIIENSETNKILVTKDAREGPRAFAEKRKPLFQGQ
jgi:enoyl-CoA hydratase